MCEHFGRCGGCTYLDIPYEQELLIKTTALTRHLGEYGKLISQIIPSPIVDGYRNKMEFAFGDEGKDGQLALGIRKKRSFYEVATPFECALIPDAFKVIAKHVLEYFQESGETFFHRKKHKGSLRHLMLRQGAFTGENLILLSTSSQLTTDIGPLVKNIQSFNLADKSTIVGILHSVNDGVADAIKSANTIVLSGKDSFNEKILELTFNVSAFSFFQTNSSGAEVLYNQVLEMTGDGELAYDLFCGTGTIAQVIAPMFSKVIGIDIVEEAITAAIKNAGQNNINNCEFYPGDVERILRTVLPQYPSPDLIIVDPPRNGLTPKSIPLITSLSPKRLIYVACKPTSLARDIPLLSTHGYTPTAIKAVDMFPRTPHIECICLFEK